jgi:hypothetical protein
MLKTDDRNPGTRSLCYATRCVYPDVSSSERINLNP